MLKTIEEIKERLIRAYDPESIILYGSQASGKATEKSDIDILIMKDTKDRPIDRRILVEKILADRAVPLDIVVYTPQEMSYLFSIGSPFIEEVIESGRVLHMRKNTESWLRDAEDELSSALILLEHEKFRGVAITVSNVLRKD